MPVNGGPVHPTETWAWTLGAHQETPTMAQTALEHVSWPCKAPVRLLPPGEDMAPSPHPWKVGAEAENHFLTSPGTPRPSKVPRRHGCSPLTTGQVCRKNCSDTSSLLPKNLSKTLGHRKDALHKHVNGHPSGEKAVRTHVCPLNAKVDI